MKRTFLIAVVLAGILAGVAAAYFFTRFRSAPPELEQATRFDEPRALPEFVLVDQAGAVFDRRRMRGHWTLLYFGFVNCPDICPTTLATLAGARKALADLPAAERPEVAFVSVDPRRDTPEVLAAYVASFDASFTGVTGKAESIEALTRALGVAVIIGPLAPDGSYSVDHSAAVFLVDPDVRVVALFGAPHEAARIARDYRRLVAAG